MGRGKTTRRESLQKRTLDEWESIHAMALHSTVRVRIARLELANLFAPRMWAR